MKNSKRSLVFLLGICVGLCLGGPLSAEELWVPPTHFYPPGLNVFPWPTSGTGLASFAFAVPDDFRAFTSATVVLIPKTNVSGNFDAYGSVKRDGEAAGTALVFNVSVPATLTAGVISEVDVTTLLATELDSTSAGADYVSVFFWFPASPGFENATVLGLRFVYDAVRVATGDIENGAVTNAKLADNSVGTDKIVNNSIGSDDVQNGSLGAVDVKLSEIQARVAESCPAGQSIRSIAQSGNVTCEPDTIGIPLVALEFSSCAGTTLCRRTVACPSSNRVSGGGIRLDEAFEYDLYDHVDLVESYPNGNASWTVTLVNKNADAVDFYYYAACVFDPGLAAPEPVSSKGNEDRPLTRR